MQATAVIQKYKVDHSMNSLRSADGENNYMNSKVQTAFLDKVTGGQVSSLVLRCRRRGLILAVCIADLIPDNCLR